MNHEFYNKLLDAFPHEYIREEQRRILKMLASTWDDKRVFVIDAPTGVGKSAIAYSVLKAAGSGYLLTSTKMLQKQYKDEFPDIREVKGKSNYSCSINDDFTAADAPCTLQVQLLKKCQADRVCLYMNARDAALSAPLSQTNYHYFISLGLASESDAEGEGGSGWKTRPVLVCDEAHEMPEIASAIFSREIDVKWISERFDVDIADVEFVRGDRDANIELLRSIYDILLKRYTRLREDLADANDTAMDTSGGNPENINVHVAKKLRTIQKKVKDLKDLVQRINWVLEKCLEDPNWVVEPINTKRLKMATIRPSEIFQRYVSETASKIVLMSASIGDAEQFIDDLGIDVDEAVLVTSDSPFDPDLSPVVIRPVLDLSKDAIDINISKMLAQVEKLASDHPDVKGIIHAGNYRLCKEILENSSQELKERLIGKAESQGHTNEILVEKHRDSQRPTILVSPSMYTGVDLKDDDSRFQIIVKLPWSYLGDPVVRVRQQEDGEWYVNEMFKKLIQASGRSTRTEDDYSVTYILDKSFSRVWNNNRVLLPEWFRKRVTWA